MAKGGIVYRKKYDSGGTVLGGPQVGTIGNAVNPQNQGPLGSVAGTLGLANTFQAAGTPIQNGTNVGQLNNAYNGVQQTLGGQTALASELSPQAQQGSIEQNQLAQQLAQRAAGGGPNPALAQLNQATGQNVANQAALMAGQRGASANPGLIARQAAQQGASIQQNAAGQAATLQAQQQIAAQQELAGLADQQINQAGQAVTNATNAQIGEQGQLQAANTAANNANVSQQANINNVNSQVAQSNANTNSNVLGGIGNALSAVAGPIGGLVSDIGSLFAHGGPVKMASGGDVNLGQVSQTSVSGAGGNLSIPGTESFAAPQQPAWAASGDGSGKSKTQTPSGKSAEIGKSAEKNVWQPTTSGPNASEMPAAGGADAGLALLALARGGKIHPGPTQSHVANFLMAKGGKIPALVSPGEIYLSPEKVQQVLAGANPMKIGQKFTGKANVSGDSKKNDTVPVTLEEGGCVIPRHIATHKMGADKAELFVRRAMAMKRAS